MRWERIDNVRREVVERGMSSLIVSDPMSIYYLSDVYIEPGERMLALLIKPDAVKLYVNALFPVEQQDGLEICVLNDGFEPTIQLSQDVSGIVGVDKNWPSRFLLALMERASIKPVVGSPAVDICRMHKDAWEMEEMRKASAGNRPRNGAHHTSAARRHDRARACRHYEGRYMMRRVCRAWRSIR